MTAPALLNSFCLFLRTTVHKGKRITHNVNLFSKTEAFTRSRQRLKFTEDTELKKQNQKLSSLLI